MVTEVPLKFFLIGLHKHHFSLISHECTEYPSASEDKRD